MLDKLRDVRLRYDEVNRRLQDPATVSDNKLFRDLMREYKNLTPLIEAMDEYEQAEEACREAKELLDEGGLEPDFKEMVQQQLTENKEKLEPLEQKLKLLLLPKDENDGKNVIVEIRGGAGGEEAALFAHSLFRMYSMYAASKGWTYEVLSLNETELGGIKEIVFSLQGEGAYSRLKFESGVHRVQRIPATESGGRIHTSTVTVAVLPEAEEVDVQIDRNDLRIDVFRASGNGGQYVNTTDSAVRITHIPTGIVVSCQDEKSQLKKKEKGLKVLYARLYELERARHDSEISAERRSQVGTGDRSERIRTYNFPQGRVTDHRIGLTIHRLDDVLNGDLGEIIDALITTDQAEKLRNQEQES